MYLHCEWYYSNQFCPVYEVLASILSNFDIVKIHFKWTIFFLWWDNSFAIKLNETNIYCEKQYYFAFYLFVVWFIYCIQDYIASLLQLDNIWRISANCTIDSNSRFAHHFDISSVPVVLVLRTPRNGSAFSLALRTQ